MATLALAGAAYALAVQRVSTTSLASVSSFKRYGRSYLPIFLYLLAGKNKAYMIIMYTFQRTKASLLTTRLPLYGRCGECRTTSLRMGNQIAT